MIKFMINFLEILWRSFCYRTNFFFIGEVNVQRKPIDILGPGIACEDPRCLLAIISVSEPGPVPDFGPAPGSAFHRACQRSLFHGVLNPTKETVDSYFPQSHRRRLSIDGATKDVHTLPQEIREPHQTAGRPVEIRWSRFPSGSHYVSMHFVAFVSRVISRHFLTVVGYTQSWESMFIM